MSLHKTPKCEACEKKALRIAYLHKRASADEAWARGLLDALEAYDGSGIPASDAADAFAFVRHIAERADNRSRVKGQRV